MSVSKVVRSETAASFVLFSIFLLLVMYTIHTIPLFLHFYVTFIFPINWIQLKKGAAKPLWCFFVIFLSKVTESNIK